jgi:hypothetical protein
MHRCQTLLVLGDERIHDGAVACTERGPAIENSVYLAGVCEKPTTSVGGSVLLDPLSVAV